MNRSLLSLFLYSNPSVRKKRLHRASPLSASLRKSIRSALPGVILILFFLPVLLPADALGVVNYEEPYIKRNYVAKRDVWGLFPTGFWASEPNFQVTPSRIEAINRFAFDSVIVTNNYYGSLGDISQRLNKLIILHPSPVFTVTTHDIYGNDILDYYDVKPVSDHWFFKNLNNVSFLIVDEPLIISLYDPARGLGARVGRPYQPHWSVTLEELAENQHLFFYGYSKTRAEEKIEEVSRHWAALYGDITEAVPDAQFYISLSGAMSRKPSFHRVVGHILDKIIRSHAPGCFHWVNDQPIPSDSALEKLARWRAYQDYGTDDAELNQRYDDFKDQMIQDIINSLYLTTVVSCGFLNWGNVIGLIQLAEVFTQLESMLDYFEALQEDPESAVLESLEAVPSDAVEYLKPYDILFREFQNREVPIDGVLTHIYPLREAGQGLETDDALKIYRGFPFQGTRVSDTTRIYFEPGGWQALEFSSNRELFTYLSRPVGLSAITRVIQQVKDDMKRHGHGAAPLYFTYQLTGSGTGTGDIYDFGATDPRNVNAQEIRAMINVAYLSGANGAFGWTDYHENDGDPDSALFNAGTGDPALDDSDTPRVSGVMAANLDIMRSENYLNWSVGNNRTVQVLREYMRDDFWVIQFRFDEKPGSEFWAVMNRRASVNPMAYAPSEVRQFGLNLDEARYVRECRFPAPPRLTSETADTFNVLPGGFRMFEASLTPLTDSRYNAILSAQTPSFLQRGIINLVEITVVPDAITPPYLLRVYLENGLDRLLLHRTEIALTGSQTLRFDAAIPPSWPQLGNIINLVVEKPGLSHPEFYHADVAVINPIGDLDGDIDVDRADLTMLLGDRNRSVETSVCGSACDLDGDGRITVLDARRLVLLCTRPRCVP